jgi:hypothetical protein
MDRKNNNNKWDILMNTLCLRLFQDISKACNPIMRASVTSTAVHPSHTLSMHAWWSIWQPLALLGCEPHIHQGIININTQVFRHSCICQSSRRPASRRRWWLASKLSKTRTCLLSLLPGGSVASTGLTLIRSSGQSVRIGPWASSGKQASPPPLARTSSSGGPPCLS